jgi:carbon monoxide dehydrogenase subunit G
MEVKLDKRYPLDVDPARAWVILSDIKAVTACMPGANLTDELSPTSYKGGVKVKVGPAVAQFGGQVDVLELDAGARKMVLRGKGADKGGSSASMDLMATIEANPDNPAHSVLHGDSAVIVNGKFAQFGGRLMVQVSDMILTQFVENFRQAAHALPAPAGVAQAGAATVDNQADVIQSPPPPPPKVAAEINGLAIFWALIKNWWLSLFGKGS